MTVKVLANFWCLLYFSSDSIIRFPFCINTPGIGNLGPCISSFNITNCLSLTLSHSLTHTHTHTHKHTHTHTHTRTHKLTHTHKSYTHTLTHSRTHAHSNHAHYLTLAKTITHTHSLTQLHYSFLNVWLTELEPTLLSNMTFYFQTH